MADENEINKKTEDLKNSMNQSEEALKNLAKLFGKNADDLKDAWTREAKSREDIRKKTEKNYENTKVGIDNLRNKLKEGATTAGDFESELAKLRDEVNKTSDKVKKAQLLKDKQDLEAENARNKVNEIFKNSMGELGGTVIKGVANSFTGAAKTALSGGDALKVATDFMSSNIDTANQASQVGSKALTDFGAATAGAGGRLGQLGVTASIVGASLSFLSNSASDLAKAGIGFMLSQTQKLMSGFQTMSSAGAMYSDGLIGMAKTAHSAHMSLEQFSKAVSENKDALSQIGMGVGEGSKKLSKAMEAGGASARKGMMALGMGMEEQAGAYAQVMAQMAGPSGKLNASNAEIAARTEEYARNLKLLSDLTGEDMKAKAEAIRQENDNLAFQQQLDGMTKEERINITESMKGMSEVQRKALRERMIYGTVISKDVAIAEAANSGLARTNQEFAQLQSEGRLNLDNTLKVQSENSDAIHEGAMSAKAMAQAGLAGNQDAAKANQDLLKTDQLTRKLQAAATEEERKKILEQMNAGKTGKRDEVGIMEAQQEFAVKMEELGTKVLPQFADAIKQTISTIEKQVDSLVKLGVAGATTSPLMTTLAGVGSALVQLVPVLSMLAAKGGASGGISGGAKELYAETKTGAKDFLKNNKGSIAGVAGGLALDYGATKAKESGHEKIGAGLDIGSAALTGASMGAMFGPMGAAVGGALGAGYGLYQNWGGLTGSNKEKNAPVGSNANGGVAMGPTSGYTSMLHGKELVLPLTESGALKSNTNGIEELMHALGLSSKATSPAPSNDMAELIKEQNSKLDDLIRIMGDNRDYTERLMHNMS